MSVPRPALVEIVERLTVLEPVALQAVVRRRLFRERVEPLPALARDEDPADILIDGDAWLRARNHLWTEIRQVCVTLAEQWADVPEVRTRPEPVGELHYLCARVGAFGARGAIARVAQREDLRGVLLPAGEGIQLRALRCLAGLLAQTNADEQRPFLPVFEQAIEVPQHLPTALTALVAFNPLDRQRYLRVAASQAPLRVDELTEHLDRNVELLLRGTDEPGGA
jgi:hypothetical protein